MRKNYFTGFRASWKAAVGGTTEKMGKKSSPKRNYHGQYDSVLLFLVQEKKWVRHSLDFKLHLKMNEQSLP